MSLEQLLAENTAALKANTVALQALAGVTTPTLPPAASTEAAPKTETKTETKPAKTTAAAESKTEGALTYNDVANVVNGFVKRGVEDSENFGRANAIAILKTFGYAALTESKDKPESWPLIKKAFEDKIAEVEKAKA